MLIMLKGRFTWRTGQNKIWNDENLNKVCECKSADNLKALRHNWPMQFTMIYVDIC